MRQKTFIWGKVKRLERLICFEILFTMLWINSENGTDLYLMYGIKCYNNIILRTFKIHFNKHLLDFNYFIVWMQDLSCVDTYVMQWGLTKFYCTNFQVKFCSKILAALSMHQNIMNGMMMIWGQSACFISCMTLLWWLESGSRQKCLYNRGIFRGSQSLLALYLGGTPVR